MKVLQINTVVSFGSTGRICRDIADILEHNGHECTIAYGIGDDVAGYNTKKIGNKFDYILHYGKSLLFNKHGFGSKRHTLEFVKWIDKFNPDLIQMHNIHGFYLNIEILFNYLKNKGIPVVWLLHDQWVFSGGPAYFDNINKETLNSKENRKEYPEALLRTNYYKVLKEKERIFSQLDNMVVVTPSKWLENLVKQTFLKKYPTKVIYNGVNTNVFKPTATTDLREIYNLKTKKILLGVATIWDSRKGIEFFRELPSKLPKDYQIVMIGVNDEMKKQLPKSIITIPKTNSIKELAEWYTVADILINPTLFDNFPTVNIESLACGTPIITYDTGGSGEAIDKLSGRVIPQNNQNAFIQSIQQWPYKNAEIVNDCLNRSKLFEKDMQYNRYLDLYEKIIQ